jgi:nuclease S1
MKAITAALLVVLGMTGPALAWGSEGHRIVAEIAEQYLEPATARQARELLRIENATTLAQVSTLGRRDSGTTAWWHFVDIPIHPPPGTPAAYDAARDCQRGDFVVAAIERFAAVLHDSSAPPRQRLEALKFVVHFVADVCATSFREQRCTSFEPTRWSNGRMQRWLHDRCRHLPSRNLRRLCWQCRR